MQSTENEVQMAVGTEDSSNSYGADGIIKLEGPAHIYHRAGLYIGGNDKRAMHHALYEVLDNSLDECLIKQADTIVVSLYPDNVCSVEDNGRGIPLEKNKDGISTLQAVYTQINTSGKFNQNNYAFSAGLNGVGAKATVATAQWFEVTSTRGGKQGFQRYEFRTKEDGSPNPSQPVIDVEIIDGIPLEQHGTFVKYQPNPNFFSAVTVDKNETHHVEVFKFDASWIKPRLEGAAALNNGLSIELRDYRTAEERSLDEGVFYSALAQEESIVDNDGLIGIVTRWENITMSKFLTALRETVDENEIADDNDESLNLDINMIDGLEDGEELKLDSKNSDSEESKVSKTAIFKECIIEDQCEVRDKRGEISKVYVSLAFQWHKDEQSYIRSYVNNIPTVSHGSHVKGFENSIQSCIKKYVETNGTDSMKKEFDKVTNSDIIAGLDAIISVLIPAPIFRSQTKEQLNDERGLFAVENTVSKHFSRILEENPTFCSDIINRILLAKKYREIDERQRMDDRAHKKVTKVAMPHKLVDCQSNDASLCELFIVEGDSAAGSAKDARDKMYQAVLPIRGKIMNILDLPMNKVFQNEEVKGIIAVLGCGTGAKFDKSKLRYDKVIMLTDADIDGKHIQTLLTTMFYVLTPELIKGGHIYAAKPPLYSVKKARSSAPPIYLQNQAEYSAFFADKDESQWEVSRFKGLGEMNYDTLRDTTMHPETSELIQLQWDEALSDQIAETFNVVHGNKGSKSKKRSIDLKNKVFHFNQDESDALWDKWAGINQNDKELSPIDEEIVSE